MNAELMSAFGKVFLINGCRGATPQFRIPHSAFRTETQGGFNAV